MDYIIPSEAFTRIDESDDEIFYSEPRLVKHIDEIACTALTTYLSSIILPDSQVLDLMASCASHLPEEIDYGGVVGLGMNQTELDNNPQLTSSLVQNLATNTKLPFHDCFFNICLITVSVQYLIHPIAVFNEIARVLIPGSPCIVSFSNRCFPTKAVAIWHQLTNTGHTKLVGQYFEATQKFEPYTVRDISPVEGEGDPLFVVCAKTQPV